MTWNEIDAQWGDILDAFRAKLPFDQLVDFDDQGSAITSNRPMGESIIVARRHRMEKFRHYLVAAGLEAPKIGPRIIHVNIGERLRMGTGGRGKVV